MFLIEIESGKFVDAEKIDLINLNGGEVVFTLTSDNESLYKVDKDLTATFCNHLQAINANINSVEAKFRELNQTDA